MKTIAIVASSTFALAGSASAYQLKETNDGLPIRWADGQVAFQIAVRDVPDGLIPVRVERAVGDAVETWATTMPNAMGVEAQAMREAPAAGNVVSWIHAGWEDEFDVLALAVTLTTYDSGTGEIRDADIFINAEHFDWDTTRGADDSSACTGRYDVENVITHEVGHALGLAHEGDVADATMYPSASICEVKKRDLDADDQAGIAYLYSLEMPVEYGGGQMGCSVTTRGRAGAGTVLALALVLAAITLGRRALACIPVLIAGLAGVAGAETVKRATLAELAVRSPKIVRAQVVKREVFAWNGRLYTDHLVAVTECMKGSCPETMVVRVLGGEKDGVGMVLEGAPVLADDAEMVLFLRPRLDGAFAVTGMAQGAFRLDRDGTQVVRVVSGRAYRSSLENLRKAARE